MEGSRRAHKAKAMPAASAPFMSLPTAFHMLMHMDINFVAFRVLRSGKTRGLLTQLEPPNTEPRTPNSDPRTVTLNPQLATTLGHSKETKCSRTHISHLVKLSGLHWQLVVHVNQTKFVHFNCILPSSSTHRTRDAGRRNLHFESEVQPAGLEVKGGPEGAA